MAATIKSKVAAALKAVDELNPDLNVTLDETFRVTAENGSVTFYAPVEDVIRAVIASVES